MAQAPHSDLEVVRAAEAPDAQKYAYYAPENSAHKTAPALDAYNSDKILYTPAAEASKPATICGLRKRTFWILVVVAIVVVAAAVGGGVGGALGSKKSSSSNSNSASAGTMQSSGAQSSSASPTPTTSQSSTVISTTTLVGPSSTITRDCPSSNNTLYDVTLGSTKMTFRKECSISFLNANGIDNVVGTVVGSLNDCIDRCAAFNINNQTEIAKGGRSCNAVCWRNTFDPTVNDWPGGMCFGFSSTNTSGRFTFRSPPETRCDSAALINAPF